MKMNPTLLVVSGLTFSISTLLVGCKKNTAVEWSDAEIQALGRTFNGQKQQPPKDVMAKTVMLERELALKMIDGFASAVNKMEEKNPNSVMNQIRRMFNPDHMKSLSFQEAIKKVEGSGAHGSIRNELKPQDHLYHALWSRIADAAGLVGFSRSSKHMKHYLGNSGTNIYYEADETQKIISSLLGLPLAKQNKKSPANPIVAQQIRERSRFFGGEVALSEAEMIAKMNEYEKSFYLARLEVLKSLAQFTRNNDIKDISELERNIAQIRLKNAPTGNADAGGVWRMFRPVGKHHKIELSEPQSDLYYALGSFAGTYSAMPIDVQIDGQALKLRFAQSVSIYDKYNWDEGKFVTLFAGWCWKLDSDSCAQIERFTALTVSDKSLGRLHKLGIAREFEIFGQGAVTTVWASVSWNDLKNPQKIKAWEATEKTVAELLTPAELMPD